MKEQKFPPGWNEDRVRRLIEHYEELDEDARVADDEAAVEGEGQTVMVIPSCLVDEVRELIVRRTGT